MSVAAQSECERRDAAAPAVDSSLREASAPRAGHGASAARVQSPHPSSTKFSALPVARCIPVSAPRWRRASDTTSRVCGCTPTLGRTSRPAPSARSLTRWGATSSSPAAAMSPARSVGAGSWPTSSRTSSSNEPREPHRRSSQSNPRRAKGNGRRAGAFRYALAPFRRRFSASPPKNGA
jgi:hypothetical protein